MCVGILLFKPHPLQVPQGVAIWLIFGLKYDFHKEAYDILEKYYKPKEFSDGRKKMAKNNEQIRVPASWLDKYTEIVEDNTALELMTADMESHIQELVDCIMAQGKMLEEVGIQPLTPEIMMSMVKTLDTKEKELSKKERELKAKNMKSVIPDKNEWN